LKINKLLIVFVIIGFILIAGYVSRTITTSANAKNLTVSANNLSLSNSTNATIQNTTLSNAKGQLLVSIGKYNARLPVLVDSIRAGNVSKDKPLVLSLNAGSHTVKVCAGALCETVQVEIKPPIKTSIDFEERLNKDVSSGLLSVSGGNYPATLPVFVDETQIGNVSPGILVNQTINVGNHTVKICNGETCFDEDIEIRPAELTSLDFGNRLKKDAAQGKLTVSIGGYARELPVFLDDTNVGIVSLGKPFDIMADEGTHTVKVCFGKVCEEEEVQIKFATLAAVDFGERLKKDVEFSTPTAKIVKSTLSGTIMTVEIEFINPDTNPHSITTTVSCVYSYTSSQNLRNSDYEQSQITRALKAGESATQQVTLSLTGGSNLIADQPVLVNITTD
jgi:hypothetical protein